MGTEVDSNLHFWICPICRSTRTYEVDGIQLQNCIFGKNGNLRLKEALVVASSNKWQNLSNWRVLVEVYTCESDQSTCTLVELAPDAGKAKSRDAGLNTSGCVTWPQVRPQTKMTLQRLFNTWFGFPFMAKIAEIKNIIEEEKTGITVPRHGSPLSLQITPQKYLVGVQEAACVIEV